MTTLSVQEVVQKGTKGVKKKSAPAPVAEPVPTPVIQEVVLSPSELLYNDIKQATLKLFKEEHVDIIRTDAQITVLLYFPEILIRNSRKDSHLIKDLFIRLVFEVINPKMSAIQIRRSTFTYAEFCSSYLHSHSNPTQQKLLTDWSSSFCWGSTPAGSYKTLLQARYDNLNYQNFLGLLKNWLHWESIEGGPYFYMNTIAVTSQSSGLITNEEVREILIKIASSNPPKLNITLDKIPCDDVQQLLNEDFINVDFTPEYLNAIKLNTHRLGTTTRNIFRTKNNTVSKDTIDSLNRTAYTFKFKNVVITPKIIHQNLETKEVNPLVYDVDPGFLARLKQTLEEDLMHIYKNL